MQQPTSFACAERSRCYASLPLGLETVFEDHAKPRLISIVPTVGKPPELQITFRALPPRAGRQAHCLERGELRVWSPVNACNG